MKHKIIYAVAVMVMTVIMWGFLSTIVVFEPPKERVEDRPLVTDVGSGSGDQFLTGLMAAPIAVTLMFGSLSLVIVSLVDCGWGLARRRQVDRNKLRILLIGTIAAAAFSSLAVLGISLKSPYTRYPESVMYSRWLVAYVLAKGASIILGISVLFSSILYLAVKREPDQMN